ncbi:diaminohydroxyphosphoribosylaminopyrimidine deaminase / 5-amino-6-(5-phosphoribosylamino)uracil reductase [Corynebacterium pseudotuberculosis]|nr:diaminohydroxyphosphoribosylaminopyrimidine deaminase / 5-amino-6-(5-phosphoribosylamino)uracil reductase [Corynebacterium pseudotuberculosis]ATQ65457.1 Riboflavin biosynthesis protein [Corynebacterium pseudotuberculosis]
MRRSMSSVNWHSVRGEKKIGLPFGVNSQGTSLFSDYRDLNSYGLSESVIAGLYEAVAQGELAQGSTSPNPPVGAAIVSAQGDIVGVGYTQPVGGPHAEVMALQSAGGAARGATIVVTLEPCQHQGRTGPCTQALLDAGIAEVVYCLKDPGRKEGGGHEFLQKNGIRVTFLDVPVRALRPWLQAQKLQRPYVVGKSAHTVDGFIAAVGGTSQWITSEVARSYAISQRKLFDAIVVGTGTALADNPRLTARGPKGEETPWQPLRVVIGSRALPENAHLSDPTVVKFLDLVVALRYLWDKGCRYVLLEGGAGLITSAFERDIIDEFHDYSAPLFLGSGKNALDHSISSTLSTAVHMHTQRVELLGEDVLRILVRDQ